LSLCRQVESAAGSGYVSPVAFGTLSLGLEQWDAALYWTQKSMDERRGWFVFARINPMFDPVREHPRFLAMLADLDARTE